MCLGRSILSAVGHVARGGKWIWRVLCLFLIRCFDSLETCLGSTSRPVQSVASVGLVGSGAVCSTGSTACACGSHWSVQVCNHPQSSLAALAPSALMVPAGSVSLGKRAASLSFHLLWLTAISTSPSQEGRAARGRGASVLTCPATAGALGSNQLYLGTAIKAGGACGPPEDVGCWPWEQLSEIPKVTLLLSVWSELGPSFPPGIRKQNPGSGVEEGNQIGMNKPQCCPQLIS